MTSATLRTHPIVIISAIAVTIFALVGTAAIMGWLPKAHTEEGSAEQAKIVSESTADKHKAVEEKHTEKAKPAKSSHVKIASAESAPRSSSAITCDNCGVVHAVNLITKEGEGTGLGAVAGGVAGGLLGNQIGKGKGNTVATVAGVAGGAYAGHQVEKTMKKTQSYKITVRMNDGSDKAFFQNTDPDFAIGEKVKIENGGIVRQ